DVLRVRVAPVLLRRVLRKRSLLPLDVALLERDVGLVGEVQVVPRDLVAEDRRPFERAQALCRDRLVVLVDVVQRRLEDHVRLPLAPELDQELEDLLAVLRESADVEVVHREALGGDAELGRRLANLAGERVRRESLGERARRDRERDVANLCSLLDEARHRSAAAELAVVGVRREDEGALPAVHAGTSARAATAASPSAAQKSGSWNSVSAKRLCTTSATKASPNASRAPPVGPRTAFRRKQTTTAARTSQARSTRPGTPVSAATVIGESWAASAFGLRKPPVPIPTSGCRAASSTPSVARTSATAERSAPASTRWRVAGMPSETPSTTTAAAATATSDQRCQSAASATMMPTPSAR